MSTSHSGAHSCTAVLGQSPSSNPQACKLQTESQTPSPRKVGRQPSEHESIELVEIVQSPPSKLQADKLHDKSQNPLPIIGGEHA